MSEPTTEAGRQLADAIHGLAKPGSFGDLALMHPRDAIEAIEDEARAQLRAEIAKGVEGLATTFMYEDELSGDRVYLPLPMDQFRSAVLALIRGDEPA